MNRTRIVVVIDFIEEDADLYDNLHDAVHDIGSAIGQSGIKAEVTAYEDGIDAARAQLTDRGPFANKARKLKEG